MRIKAARDIIYFDNSIKETGYLIVQKLSLFQNELLYLHVMSSSS